MGVYPPSGPFVSGGSPPLDASLFNNVETWIALIDNTSGTVLNGATSGTATLYQPFRGVFKVVLITQNNFRNGSGSVQTITLPVAFTTALRFWTGDTNTMNFVGGGTARNAGVITALATTGGSRNVQTDIPSYAMGDCFGNTIDTISFNSGQASAHNGISVLIGI